MPCRPHSTSTRFGATISHAAIHRDHPQSRQPNHPGRWQRIPLAHTSKADLFANRLSRFADDRRRVHGAWLVVRSADRHRHDATRCLHRSFCYLNHTCNDRRMDQAGTASRLDSDPSWTGIQTRTSRTAVTQDLLESNPGGACNSIADPAILQIGLVTFLDHASRNECF